MAGEERPASTGNNRATCVTLRENVTHTTLQRYGKMFHGQTLKCATSDYDQRHVIAFRPISAAARSWSYDNFDHIAVSHTYHREIWHAKEQESSFTTCQLDEMLISPYDRG